MKANKRDIVWNYVGIFMSLSSNFLILPFMIYFLESDELGLWYVFLSIGAIVTLFDFGFNPTLARNVNYCWNGALKLSKADLEFTDNLKPNFLLLKKVIATCKKIYLIISIVALIVLITIGTMYIIEISKELKGNDHFIAWGIYCSAVFLNLYYGYYTVFLRGVGAIAQSNIANVVSRFLQILISIILLFLGFNLIAVSIAYFIYGILFRILSKNAFYKFENIGQKLDEVKVNSDFKDIKNTFSIIWHNAWRDGLVSVSRYLTVQASVIISSLFFSLTVTGVYSISIQLITALSTIAGALYTAYQPSLQSAYINNRQNDSKVMMSLAMTVYGLTFWFGFIALIIIGVPLLGYLNPDTVINIPILLGIAIYDFLLKHHSYYASYISNTNKVTYMKSFLISSLMSILLAIVLIKVTSWDLWALIIAQIISQVIYNNWAWPYKVMRSLDTNMKEMFEIGIREILKFGSLYLKKRKAFSTTKKN
ncbi:O-unit flippase-like protein [Planomicrobium okeanokoites]|uniref:O-unit flippase-like protein n=1 Tax=Planomicrobium okeanokoites TaxID=244 RepID=UPI0024912F05|nr:O-unit flippase-like protein [Planomicrobium okeanokoites]